jgi:hypothetical protein
VNTKLYFLCNLASGSKEPAAAGHVKKSLIDTDLLHQIRELKKDRHDALRRYGIPGHVGPGVDTLRAETPRLRDRLRGMDPELPSLVRTGGDDAASLPPLGIRPHNHRFSPPFGVISLLYRREERIHVDM